MERPGKSRPSEHAGISFPMVSAGLVQLLHPMEPKTTIHHGMEPSGKSPEHVGKSKAHQGEHASVLNPSDKAGVVHTSKEMGSSPLADHSSSHMADHSSSHMADHDTSHMTEHSSHHLAIDHGPLVSDHTKLQSLRHAEVLAGMALSAAERNLLNVHVSQQGSDSEMTPSLPAASESMLNMHMPHQTPDHLGMEHSGLFYHLTDHASTSHT